MVYATLRSQIEPMKKIARSLREHRDLILNWFRARGTVSAGSVEGLNNKAKLTTEKLMVFAPTKPLKSRYITHLASFPSQNLPTNSVEEALLFSSGWPDSGPTPAESKHHFLGFCHDCYPRVWARTGRGLDDFARDRNCLFAFGHSCRRQQ